MVSRKGRALGRAWLALTAVVAAHVLDEALTGFLDVYNPIVRSIRLRYAWFPAPTFNFGTWISGLVALVAVLLAVTPLAYRRARAVRLAAFPFAAIMLLNGFGHLAGSLCLRRWAPGATTAPLLIAASVWLFVEARGSAPELRHDTNEL